MNEHQDESKTGKRRTWLIVTLLSLSIAFIALLGLLIGASWVTRQTEDARVALQDYCDALVAGEYDKAYALRDSDLQRVLSESDFQKSHELASSRFGKLVKVALEPGQKVGNRSGITVTINTRLIYEHSEDRFAVVMKKEGTRWSVHESRYITH
jgi:hypothetical protein